MSERPDPMQAVDRAVDAGSRVIGDLVDSYRSYRSRGPARPAAGAAHAARPDRADHERDEDAATVRRSAPAGRTRQDGQEPHADPFDQGWDDELLTAARSGAHRAIDVLLDVAGGVLHEGVRAGMAAAQRVVPPDLLPNLGVAHRSRRHPPGALVLTTAGPGEVATGRMIVTNDGSRTAQVTPRSTTLAAAYSDFVWAHHVEFDPSSFDLEPDEYTEVDVTLRLPTNVKSGWYCGLVRLIGIPGAHLVLCVEVT